MGTVSRVRQQRVSNLVRVEKVRDERKAGKMRSVNGFCCDEKGREMGTTYQVKGKQNEKRRKKKRGPEVAPFASWVALSPAAKGVSLGKVRGGAKSKISPGMGCNGCRGYLEN